MKIVDSNGLQHLWAKMKAYLKLKNIVPEQTKTFTDVIGTANTWAGATFFFGSIKPDSWSQLWTIKYKIHTYVPGYPARDQLADVTMTGSEGVLRTYTSYNRVAPTYPAYNHELYRMKQAGFTNGYGHALGVRFQSAYDPINTSYKRTIEVEIYDTENCSFVFYDSCLPYASIPGTGSTNYDTYSEVNYASSGLQETGDANDVNYQNRVYYSSRKTYTNLYRYQIVFSMRDKTLLPVNAVNNSTATGKTLTTESFDPFGEIYYFNTTSTYSAGANIGNSQLYRQILADLRYSFNLAGTAESHLTARQPVYLVTVLQPDGLVKLDSNPLSQSLPASDDGKLYIYMGMAYEDTYPYRLELAMHHPIYRYKDGQIRLYTGADANVQSDWNQATTTADDYIKNKPTIYGPSSTAPKVNGTATVGTESAFARGDHVHPSDTSKVSKNGDTMTGKLTLKGGQYTDAYNSGSLDLNNSNIDGVNSIYTADASDNAQEGIHFYRDSTHVDSLHARQGTLYFTPNRQIGSAGTPKAVLCNGDNISEAYLQWGGKNFSASYGAIDAAMCPELGANRLSLIPAESISVEYSRDGGTTWVDYGASDADKQKLFSEIGAAFYIGKAAANGEATTDWMFRATITSDLAHVYTVLNKFVIYINTNGCTCWVSIDKALKNSESTFVNVVDHVPIAGWSGYNVINTPGITTYGNTPASQYSKVRFTFGCTAINSSYRGLCINKIYGFGGVGWTTPNTLAKYGRIYTYDVSQNVTFPANVTATGYVNSTTPSSSDNSTKAATTAFVNGQWTSAKITNTLGYTPYNGTTNPNGYLTLDTAPNSFSNIKVGSTTVAADATGDTLELVAGNNITLTPDATNDKVTIAATNTTYSDATTSASGLMSSTDKSKLNGINAGAEVNQNAFSNIKVGSSTIAAESKTDTLELIAGTNITLTPDVNNDKITISASGGESGGTTIFYGTCSTLGSNSEKEVTCSNWTLTEGNIILIQFSQGNTASNITLNVNNTGAYAMYYSMNNQAGANFKGSGYYLFRLNSLSAGGYRYHLIGTLDTTYSNVTTSANGLMSSSDKTKLNGIATGAEVNQNAFSNVKVGSSTIAADSKTDTLELVAGNNITLTPDATNDKVTIAATNTTYSDATTSASGLMSSTDKSKLDEINAGAEVNQNAFSNIKVGSTTVAANGKTDTLELVAGTNITLTPDATNDKVTITATDTTYSNATTSANGLMSAADKTKLDSVGTKYPNTTAYGSFSKSLTSSTDASYFGVMTLPSTGVWIIHVFFDCPADPDGYRYVCFGTSATDSSRRTEYACGSCPGASNVRGRAQFTYLADISSTNNLNFYIWGCQNSGNTYTCRVYYRAVKVSNN